MAKKCSSNFNAINLSDLQSYFFKFPLNSSDSVERLFRVRKICDLYDFLSLEENTPLYFKLSETNKTYFFSNTNILVLEFLIINSLILIRLLSLYLSPFIKLPNICFLYYFHGFSTPPVTFPTSTCNK